MSRPNPQKPEEALLTLRVTPKASKPRMAIDTNGQIKAWVSAPPVDGAANEAVCELVAKTLGIAKSKVELTSGHAHRSKVVRVLGLSKDEAIGRIASSL